MLANLSLAQLVQLAQLAQLALLALGAALALPAPAAATYPGALYSQYHAQDELGQYSFGYAGPTAAKHEQKTADGVTRGYYSYMDPHGRMQTRSYTADDVNGFRVAASDLPAVSVPGTSTPVARVPGVLGPDYQTTWQRAGPVTRWSLTSMLNGGQVRDTPAVAAAKAQHFAAVQRAKLRSAVVVAGPEIQYLHDSSRYLAPSAAYPLEHRYVAATAPPTPYVQQRISAALPQPLPAGLASQYHAQDELGQYSFGYANENASKMETKTADGVTRGSFSYVDANGLLQSRSYVADAGGFRVVASDLPQVDIAA